MRTWDFTHSGIRQTLSRLFYQHGLLVAHYPKSLLILLCVTIPVLASPILMWSLFDKLTLSPRYWSSTAQNAASSSSEARTDSSYFHCILYPDQCNDMPPHWFNGAPALSLQQIVVSFSSYRQPIGNILRNAQKISEHLFSVIDKSFKEFNSGNSSEQICYRVESSFLDDSIYPKPKCLVLSPIPIILNIFHEKPSKILDPYTPQTLTNDSQLRNPFSSVKELLFGGFWTHWSSILGLGLVDTSDQLTFSLTLFLNTSQQIQTEQSEFVSTLRKNLGSSVKQTEWLHIFYPRDEELVELFPLIFLYSVVFLYISISVSKIEEVKSRVGLACAAVLTLFGSVCISVGMCILFGLRATLDGRDVVPFIIVVIGLENILLVTNCVISTPRELDAPLRIAKGLGQQGVAITRSLATQISLLLLAYLTFNPAIQEFCIISILGLLNNFFLLMAFFVPILSIDLKRLELSDVRDTHVDTLNDLANLHRGTTANKNPIYLSIIHKLEEVRILQKLFTFLLCVLLAWWLITSRTSLQVFMQEIDDTVKLRHAFSAILGSDDSAEDTTMKQVNQEESNPYFQELHENIISDRQYVHDKHYSFTLQPSNDSNIALCGANPCWTELIKYHLPNLFAFYDISLIGEYITLLPPVYLRAVGSREVSSNEVNHVGHAGYLRPPEFGLDFLFMIIGSILTLSLALAVSNQLVFNFTLHKGMPSNSDLHNANISYQILGTLYDGSQVIQPLEYVIYNNSNIIATRLRDMRLQVWNISPKQNNFSIIQQRQINLAESTHPDSSDVERQRGAVSESDSTDSSSKGEDSSTIRGYEFPKHFNFLAPHLDSLRATLPERQKRVPLIDPNAPILWCVECCDSWLAAGFQNGLVTLWNIHSSQLVLQLQPTATGITCIQIIPRPHNLIICGTIDGIIVKIPISNPSLVQKFKISNNMTTHIEYAHNRVVVSNFECALRVYRVDRMTELFTLMRHPGYITCLSIDNKPLLGCATGCKKGMVCSWDLETGTCVRNFQETQHKIISILTTTSLIISLAMDRMVRMRERRSGELVKKIQPDSMPRSMCLLTENLLVVGCKGCAVLYNLTYDMLEPKVIQLRDGKEMDHVSKILKISTSVFACTTRRYIYMLSWGISKKEKID